ncbi:MAG: VOC family protein [Ruminococcus sp.]|nr:VOC family protein [Ruminococcus sp.]
MKLKNILFVVSDIEKSVAFYKELFGLFVVTDFGENVILSEGLVLQEKNLWEKFLEKETSFQGHDAELYFEENDLDRFLEKLKNSAFEIEYVNPLMEHDWGQRVVRLYDPDRHVIEVGESLEYVARRLLRSGLSVEQTAEKVQMPLDWMKEICV